MRDDRSRLEDILRAVDRIQSETLNGRDAFIADAKIQVWVLYHLQVVGEACRVLSLAFREKQPNAIWSKAVGLRNILVHHYFEIDEELVWQVVVRDLPELRAIVEAALRSI